MVATSPIPVDAIADAFRAMSEAASSMFGAAMEARARIREAELEVGKAAVTGSLDQIGTVLTTIDRPTVEIYYPNRGGGETKVMASLQTLLGGLVIMEAYNDRHIDAQANKNWRELSEAFIGTIGFATNAQQLAYEAAEATIGDGSKTNAGEVLKQAIFYPGRTAYNLVTNPAGVGL